MPVKLWMKVTMFKICLMENKNTYWCPREGTEKCEIKIDLKDDKEFDRVVLQEHIKNGQRVEKFTLEYLDGDKWKNLL